MYTVLSVGVCTHFPEFSLLAQSVLTTQKKLNCTLSSAPWVNDIIVLTSSPSHCTGMRSAPLFRNDRSQKKLAHGMSYHSAMLQMRLTIPSQIKPTTSELCFRSISAHQCQFVGSLAERVLVRISLQPTELSLRTAVPLQWCHYLPPLPHHWWRWGCGWMKPGLSPSFIFVMLSFCCPPCNVECERKLWMNQQPFLISSLLSICPPSLFPSIREREREREREQEWGCCCADYVL